MLQSKESGHTYQGLSANRAGHKGPNACPVLEDLKELMMAGARFLGCPELLFQMRHQFGAANSPPLFPFADTGRPGLQCGL